MSKRWEFRKPWCLAGLSLSGCICWSVLQIPEARAKLQPVQPCKSTGAVPGCHGYQGQTHQIHTGSAPAMCCWWGPRVGVLFSVWHWCSYRVGKWGLSIVQNVSHSSPCPGYLELICFVLEFHCVCWSLGTVLEGWLSILVRIGIPYAQPCTSSRVNSPSANHAAANAGSLLLH